MDILNILYLVFPKILSVSAQGPTIMDTKKATESIESDKDPEIYALPKNILIINEGKSNMDKNTGKEIPDIIFVTLL